MSIEENRNCGCNCMCNEEENTVDCDMRREMIQEIRCLEFGITELALYLDTHPNDRSMIDLFNQLSADAKAARREYESKYGPLLVNSNEGYPWTWNNMPWPWEND